MKFILCFLIIYMLPVMAQANIQSDLESFFNSLSSEHNPVSYSVYEGQLSNYYTGGHFSFSSEIRDVEIAHIDLPSYTAGCGGIDLFTGGFSFINAEDFISLLKNILNNAKGYAFNLALESATPEIANTMKYVADLANKVNQTNINTCQTAASLVGALWPRTQESQRYVCADIATHKGIFDDYTAARQGCGKEGQMSSILEQGEKDKSFKDFIVANTNIAWQAIRKNRFLNQDKELAQLFLSLSGSIIIYPTALQDNTSNQFTLLPSLANQASLWQALLYGGKANWYVCDTLEDCIHPHISVLSLLPEAGLYNRILKKLEDILDKIQKDQALSEEEIRFLNSNPLPLYRLLSVQWGLVQDKRLIPLKDYAEFTALDLLFSYLSQNLLVLQNSSTSLQYPEIILEKFHAQIQSVLDIIQVKQARIYQKMQLTFDWVKREKSLEKSVLQELSVDIKHSLQKS